jgi:hypothetical protein
MSNDAARPTPEATRPIDLTSHIHAATTASRAAPYVGRAAQRAVEIGAEKLLLSSTKVPIRDLWGVVQNRAMRAAVGGGAKSFGGGGMDLGDARLRKVKLAGMATVYTVVGVGIGLSYLQQRHDAALLEKAGADVVLCANCQVLLPDTAADGDHPVDSACPHCGHPTQGAEQQ